MKLVFASLCVTIGCSDPDPEPAGIDAPPAIDAALDSPPAAACALPKTVPLAPIGTGNRVVSFCWGTIPGNTSEQCAVLARSNCDLGTAPPVGSVLFRNPQMPSPDLQATTLTDTRITATTHGVLMMSSTIGDRVTMIPDLTDVTLTVEGRALTFRFDTDMVTVKSWQ